VGHHFVEHTGITRIDADLWDGFFLKHSKIKRIAVEIVDIAKPHTHSFSMPAPKER